MLGCPIVFLFNQSSLRADQELVKRFKSFLELTWVLTSPLPLAMLISFRILRFIFHLNSSRAICNRKVYHSNHYRFATFPNLMLPETVRFVEMSSVALQSKCWVKPMVRTLSNQFRRSQPKPESKKNLAGQNPQTPNMVDITHSRTG